MSAREQMEFDVLIVGAGPAGLSAAIRIKQLAQEKGDDISVCVLEKAAEIGGHTLSGAVMDPTALSELFPNWKEKQAPLNTPVVEDRFFFLSQTSAKKVPSFLLPHCFHNEGNFVISLSDFVKWLGNEASELGVDIFPGFPAREILYDEKGEVCGVLTGDMGRAKDGSEKPSFQPGMEIRAPYTLFAEGSRGHLGRELIDRFKLAQDVAPQTYALGIKELWQVEEAVHQPGLVVHTAGWPLDYRTYGGGFLYHLDQRQIVVGYVVGLGYENPYLSPFEEFQRYKNHPLIRRYLVNGKRLSYGARSITAGGIQSLPQLTFPGGALIGCEAGFLNAARIKGSHAAIKSGMLAAEALMEARQEKVSSLTSYPTRFRKSWLYQELHQTRNFKPMMATGLWTGSLMFGIDQLVFRGRFPLTWKTKTPDHAKLKPKHLFLPIVYPKPDGKVTFDRLSSVFLSNTNHEENQPVHLTLKNPEIPIQINLAQYDGPEARFCPAGVYEFIDNEKGEKKLQINAQNCVHCKTCDIKDPSQNIVWVTPEGGGGPNYIGM